MAERVSPPRVDLYQVAEIVSSYVRHHQIAADQLAGLIVEVHRALAGLGRAPPVQEPLTPAVPIRRSVQRDYVICLECGYRARTLRRHLRVAHGLDCRRLPHPLELAGGSSIDRAELFGAPLDGGQADGFWAQTRCRHGAPAGRRSPAPAASRA